MQTDIEMRCLSWECPLASRPVPRKR